MEDRILEDRELAERHLFIIARDQASLWEYLRREFASETNVEVILDRRLGRDRRSAFDRIAPLGPMGETMGDRRTGERRIRDFVAAQLRSIGYAMLRIRRSEEHTSELQSQSNLVCRLLLEKKKNIDIEDTVCTTVTE